MSRNEYAELQMHTYVNQPQQQQLDKKKTWTKINLVKMQDATVLHRRRNSATRNGSVRTVPQLRVQLIRILMHNCFLFSFAIFSLERTLAPAHVPSAQRITTYTPHSNVRTRCPDENKRQNVIFNFHFLRLHLARWWWWWFQARAVHLLFYHLLLLFLLHL